jgi:hypothetical protein
MRKVQRDWELRWRKDFPDSRIQRPDSPDFPDAEPNGRWAPAFKIVIQPLCEKDVGSATYAYLFIDVPKADERMQRQQREGPSATEDAQKSSGNELGSPPQPDVTP